ncbi:MAG: type VI secretion system tube protein Hcp [Chitinophagaceae bacterium]|nr:MAG: type VI secretion system tube protein Hcp [Chitinophagaceae bacterium]
MINNAYLILKSKTHGTIKSNSTQRGREGYIALVEVNHELISPRDMVTGRASGRRQHKFISITKEIDNTTPVFNQLLVQNIEIEEANLLFFGPSQVMGIGFAAGAERLLYSIKLKNAFIAKIGITLHNLQKPQENQPVFVENISLVYQKIEWVWAQGNISAIDEWGGAV